jgi:hypothetical protein
MRTCTTLMLQLAAACAALLLTRQADAQETSVNALRTDSPDSPANNAPAASDGERVLLEELMPALSGSPEGTVPVAPAPAPGTSMTVSRADVQRALAQAGMRESLKAKDIPKSMKVSRESLTLTREDLSAQATDAVRAATEPCTLGDVRYPHDVRVHAGPRKFRVELNGLRSGSLTGAVFIATGGRETRVPIIASLNCPPPEIAVGAQVIAVAQVGPVKATAPAEARQAGRVGEIIRITNRATGASLRARILSSRTVEVVP